MRSDQKPKGCFITFEGIEGVGKSTQAGLLAEALKQGGVPVCVTREPGGTPAGEAIREILLHRNATPIDDNTELLLIFSARAQNLTQVVRPALAEGRVVVCDRFTDATYAYQAGGRGIPRERIAQLELWVQEGLRPDLTLLLDAPVTISRERAQGRGNAADRFEREHIDFFERVRGEYLRLANQEPARIELVDASADMATIHKLIYARVRRAMQR
ncbi:MAG: dTMP kinase [Gammaproteobacteria bacterium RIFCSPLOWO2_02_FULL_61_13]|nr:MAG: dTMP kinase [Gammaproteobacteria bacterium RIFCSPLOWO2_02_FULL_61_13]